jgi:hypothetical protein
MLVSAITTNNNGYRMSNSLPFSKIKDNDFADTTFNSLTPYGRKSVENNDAQFVYDSINQWKNFCHKQILGEKLNIIA